ncbi:hypothetical protein SD70_27165 [Gordoniibacillus kamchatkensis]|uniref:Uncharacterized protein n=1 Tax=Gordoniibacillus kamchatkensis TaxID=1590651 RepID=A0ABR5AC95_9BACL|nr:hypothetical protein [Paenibacillus sp. VKM B-2647]KIL38298.1 hypothetical protein SD70_27165 [Paenibacillus sp. VKM B-2647]
MDGYKHYIRIDANNIVIHAFSDAFEQPLGTDILVESNAGRHFNPALTDGEGNFIYKWNGMQMVSRANDPDYLLAAARASKLAEINTAATNALQTFTSSALGTPHTYLSGTNDMLLLEAEDRFMQGPDYDNQPIFGTRSKTAM